MEERKTRRNKKNSLVKKILKKVIKTIASKIKQLAKYIFTTAKHTRLRTKLVYVLLALVAFGVFNYRKGEYSLPVKVAIYDSTPSWHYTNAQIYDMDEDELEEAERNNILSVYRDGFKYYVTGKGYKYRITRNEFLKCVYKKDYSKSDKYEVGELTQGVVLTYETFNDKWEQEGKNSIYSKDITSLLNEKIEKEESKENEEEEDNYSSNTGKYRDEEEEKKIEKSMKRKEKVDRIKDAWSDLCFKYRVNASEMVVLYNFEDRYNNNRTKNKNIPNYQVVDYESYFGKNYEKKDLTQNERPQSEHIKFDYRLLGIGNFVDIEDLIAYTTMISLDKQSKLRRKIKNRFAQKMEIANSVDIYKATTYLNTVELPENLPYYTKTYTRGKNIIQICIDNVNDVAFAVVFNTDDVITKKALSMEMNSFMLNKFKNKVWVNWYLVVRMVLFMIVEWIVFVYMGRRRKNKILANAMDNNEMENEEQKPDEMNVLVWDVNKV